MKNGGEELKKSICVVTLLLIFLLTGCNQYVVQDSVQLPYPPVVVWDNKAYAVTIEIVPNEQVGDKFGEIIRYVDPKKNYPEFDGDSTIAPIGSGLFYIKGYDLKYVFAVEMDGQYIKAEYSEP